MRTVNLQQLQQLTTNCCSCFSIDRHQKSPEIKCHTNFYH